MALHAAAMMAFLVDSVQQAPIQIQCVQQSSPDSWLKQWIPTAVSLLSIGIGVWIARWSFRASSERDHKRWVLDQKKGEWSRLLESAANINRIVYLGKTMTREIEEGLKNELKPAIRALSVALANCIFLEEFRPNSEKGKKITDFIKSAYITSNKISMRLELFDSTREKETSSDGNSQDELVKYVNSILDEGFEFAGKTSDLLLWLQIEAAKDLMS
jgi:hypothetical protein